MNRLGPARESTRSPVSPGNVAAIDQVCPPYRTMFDRERGALRMWPAVARKLGAVGLLALFALAAPARAQGPLDEILPASHQVPTPLGRPLDPPAPKDDIADLPYPLEHFVIPRDPPPGFTGRSSVLPTVVQEDAHFLPVEDRWRIGFPEWDRYGKGHPCLDDYPYDVGAWYNPYKQSVLKGDYPIFGQNTFLEITATSFTLTEPRQVPTATTPFESTVN